MIELRTYATSDKVRGLFDLCKSALSKKVDDYPVAKTVIARYASIPDPDSMPIELTKTKYTDAYVTTVNNMITEIMLNDQAEDFVNAFERLTELTIEIVP